MNTSGKPLETLINRKLSRDLAQKLCLLYVMDSQSGQLSAPRKIGTSPPGRRATGKWPGSSSPILNSAIGTWDEIVRLSSVGIYKV